MPATLSPVSVLSSRAPRLFFAASIGFVGASALGLGVSSARATPKPAPKSNPAKKTAKVPAKAPIKATPVKNALVRKPAKPAPPVSRGTQALASRGVRFTAVAPVPVIRISAASALGSLGAGGDSAMVELVASGKGRINYEANVVKAVGLGALPPPTLSHSRAQDVLAARHAALADALRTLGMAINQVRVSSDSRVQNYVLQSDEIRLRVRALVQASQVVEEKYLPVPGVFRVVVQTPLTGPNSLSEAVGVGEENAPSKKATLAASKSKPAPEVEPSPVAPDPFAPGSPAPEGVRYTSLIVDCRGLGVQACMSPRVFQKCGDEVYGTMHVSPDYVIETGIAAFPRSMKDALRTARTGERPLIIRANHVKDENRFYPVVSDRDAEAIFAADKDSHFFARTAVILLLDPTER